MRKLLLFTCLLFAISSVYADIATPFEFKGMRIGDSVDLIGQSVYKCEVKIDSNLGDFGCNSLGSKITVAEEPATIFISAKEKKITYISVHFQEKSFVVISEAFIEKYGKPSSIDNNAVTNAMGAEFQNKEISWKNGVYIIKLTQRSGKIDRSSALFTSTDTLDQFSKDKQLKSKTRSKDL